MSLFSINFNIHLIYVIIYWALEILIRVSMFYMPDYFEISDNPKMDQYMFIIFSVISRLLSVFLILYVYCEFHKKKEINSKDNLIYENPIKNKKDKYYILHLLFITCLELLARACNFIFFWSINASKEETSMKNSKDVLTLLDILIRTILSVFMLKVKTYRHHIWSICVMVFSFLLIIPFDIYDVYYEETVSVSHTILYILVLSFQSFIYPLEDTYVKKFFNNYYILPENLLFMISFSEAIVISIISVLFYFTGVLNFDLTITTGRIIGLIFYILAIALQEYIIVKIIYLFSSQFISFLIISQSITVSIIDIINFIKDTGNVPFHVYLSFPFEIIALILNLIATSVYNEIIIINKCGLNLNVKKGISDRGRVDTESTFVELSENNLENIDERNSL